MEGSSLAWAQGVASSNLTPRPIKISSLGRSSHIQPKTSVKDLRQLRFPNTIQVEIVLAERIDVLPKKRRNVTQCLVVDFMPFGSQLANDLANLDHVPGDDGVVQNG